MAPSSADTFARTGGRELRRIVYSEEVIAARVREMGVAITERFPEGEEILLLGLLKGSFIFMADLCREIARPLVVDFIVAGSYGAGTVSSGNVRLLYDPSASLEGRHVLLVEDIIDSGNTINKLVPVLQERKPKTLSLCALLHKHIAKDLVIEPEWIGFDAPSEFLVGYGLDHSENYRNLPFIASI